MTWAPVPDGSDFPIENLPFGVFRPRDDEPRVGVRIGDHVLDLVAAGIDARAHRPAVAQPADGERARRRGARRVGELLTGAERPDLLLPIDEVAGAAAGRGGRLRRLLLVAPPRHEPRPHAPPRRRAAAAELAPPAGRLPRPGGTVVVERHAGRPARRARRRTATGRRSLAPTRALDIELEVGFVVGGPPAAGIAPDDADRHVFGVVLLNDWSARDIQAFEYQPLGPLLARASPRRSRRGSSRSTRCARSSSSRRRRTRVPDPYLRAALPWGLDLDLHGRAQRRARSRRTNFSHMYWTFAQQLAHMTVNGAPTGAGDLFGSGTVSGPTPASGAASSS